MTDRRFTSIVNSFRRAVPESLDIYGEYEIIGYYKVGGPNPNIRDVRELFYHPTANEAVKVLKGEDVLNFMRSGTVQKVTLDGLTYMAYPGMLVRMTESNRPERILIQNFSIYNEVRIPNFSNMIVTLFDGSIFRNQNMPLERFIIRKLIPKLSELSHCFGFVNLNDNLIVPEPPNNIDDFSDLRTDIAQMYREHVEVYYG